LWSNLRSSPTQKWSDQISAPHQQLVIFTEVIVVPAVIAGDLLFLVEGIELVVGVDPGVVAGIQQSLIGVLQLILIEVLLLYVQISEIVLRMRLVLGLLCVICNQVPSVQVCQHMS
jgi:hypothetical protein